MTPPIDVRPLFAPLDGLLIDFLRSLPASHWQYPTIAGQWCIKDVAAHLLDGNIKTISMMDHGWFGDPPSTDTSSYEGLVAYLNHQNATWVQAMKRASPNLITDLLEETGLQYTRIITSLAPFHKALFSVAWAGEQTSYNWMHVAREYTEKWHHQQQVREAVGDTDTLLSPQYFLPFFNTIMLGLPHALRNTAAPAGTLAEIKLVEYPAQSWQVIMTGETWQKTEGCSQVHAVVELRARDAWQLFTKSKRPPQIKDRIKINGDQALATAMLNMVSVMA